VHALVRSRVPTLDDDRPPSPDIAAIVKMIATGMLENACGDLVK
jgi:histidine ammonia-lyase